MMIHLALAGPKASAVDYSRFGGVIRKAWVYAEQHFALPRMYAGKPEHGGCPGLNTADDPSKWFRSCIEGKPYVGTCEAIPSDVEDGYAFIDVEAWSPDPTRLSADGKAARNMLRTHLEYAGRGAVESDRYFTIAAQACLASILEAAKAARPNVRWGHWSLPHWDGDLAAIAPVLDHCQIGTLANYPHYWLVDGLAQAAGEQDYRSAEAANAWRYKQVRLRLDSIGLYDKPIVGTTALRCLANGPHKGQFLDEFNLKWRIGQSRGLGCEAVVAWYECWTDQDVSDLHEYAETVLIPTIT